MASVFRLFESQMWAFFTLFPFTYFNARFTHKHIYACLYTVINHIYWHQRKVLIQTHMHTHAQLTITVSPYTSTCSPLWSTLAEQRHQLKLSPLSISRCSMQSPPRQIWVIILDASSFTVVESCKRELCLAWAETHFYQFLLIKHQNATGRYLPWTILFQL